MKQIRIFLDIDGVLASASVTPVADSPALTYLTAMGSVICPGAGMKKTLYVFPGVLELIRYLTAQPNVQIGFYSAGEEARNQLFVEQLLRAALGEDGVKTLAYAPRLRSRHEMSCKLIGDREIRKKDLRLILTKDEHDLLPNTLLVDDRRGNAAAGQEQHLLQSLSVKWEDFDKLKEPEMMYAAHTAVTEQFAQLNHIFYLAGLLQYCIERTKEVPISTVLTRLQYGNTGRQLAPPSTREPHWYTGGLKLLQQYAPSLQFNTHELFAQVVYSSMPIEPVMALAATSSSAPAPIKIGTSPLARFFSSTPLKPLTISDLYDPRYPVVYPFS